MLNPYIEAYELRELVLKKEVKLREVAEFFIARVAEAESEARCVHDYHTRTRDC